MSLTRISNLVKTKQFHYITYILDEVKLKDFELHL